MRKMGRKVVMAVCVAMLALSSCGQEKEQGNVPAGGDGTDGVEKNQKEGEPSITKEAETDLHEDESMKTDLHEKESTETMENLAGEYNYGSGDETGKLMIQKTLEGYDISDYESESSYRFLADASNIETIEGNRIYIKYPEQVFSDDTVDFGYYILEFNKGGVDVYYGKSAFEGAEFLYHAAKAGEEIDCRSDQDVYFLSMDRGFYEKAASNPIDQKYEINAEAAPLEVWQSALEKCGAWNEQMDFTVSGLGGFLKEADNEKLQDAVRLWREYYQEEVEQNRELYGNNGMILGSMYTAISADVLVEKCKLASLAFLSQEYELSGNVTFAEHTATASNGMEYSPLPQSFCIEYSPDFEETLLSYSINEKDSGALEELIHETANKIEEIFGHGFAKHADKYVSFVHALYEVESGISEEGDLCLVLKENRLRLYTVELLNIAYMLDGEGEINPSGTTGIEGSHQDPVIERYVNVLRNYISEGKTDFSVSFIDLDDDSTREMVVFFGESEADGGSLFTMKDQEVIQVVAEGSDFFGRYGGFTYKEKGNVFVTENESVTENQISNQIFYYTMENGKAVCKDMTQIVTQFERDESEYYINNTEVESEEYNEIAKSYGLSEMSTVSYSDGVRVRDEQMDMVYNTYDGQYYR